MKKLFIAERYAEPWSGALLIAADNVAECEKIFVEYEDLGNAKPHKIKDTGRTVSGKAGVIYNDDLR